MNNIKDKELMKKYTITAQTNPWIAQRDAMFGGKTSVILEKNLTLKEAQNKLLDLYNRKFENERYFAKNWGIAVIQSADKVDRANPTFRDGTRSFEYDSRTFSIEVETHEYIVVSLDGKCLFYVGGNIRDAADAILGDEEPQEWKLAEDGEIIWNGDIHGVEKLKELVKGF